MTKLKAGMFVVGTHPALGGTVEGEVMIDNLNSRMNVLVKFSCRDGDQCVQVDSTGSGFVFPKAEKAKSTTIPCILILNADGTVLPFEPTETSRGGGSKMAAVIRADRNPDGTYSNFNFESFEAEDVAEGANANSPVAEGMDGLPPSMQALFKALFGPKDPNEIN